MNIKIESRDMNPKSYVTGGSHNHSSQNYVNNTMLSIEGIGRSVSLVERVRIQGIWFMMVPEKMQDTLEKEWDSMGNEPTICKNPNCTRLSYYKSSEGYCCPDCRNAHHHGDTNTRHGVDCTEKENKRREEDKIK